MTLSRRLVVLSPLLALLASPLLLAADPSPADLVIVRPGTLPIILTAPHGGEEPIPGVKPRATEGKDTTKGKGVIVATDSRTDKLTLGIAAELEKLTGGKPYVVVARFKRIYLDVNRPPEIGLDQPKARPYYEYYHGTIRKFVDEVRAKYPHALLIDVHGQGADKDVIMRGTRNGATVKALLARAGAAALTGPHGLFGQLEAHGFKISPANSLPLGPKSENGGYNGGHTVGIYGSGNPNGIDAMQTEFGTHYRDPGTVDQSAKNAAAAIADFYEHYLKSTGK